MNELKIINGQFVKDGQVVKPEFGDKQQIQLLKSEVNKEDSGDIEKSFEEKLKEKMVDEIEFCEENEFEKNEHGVYLYVSANGYSRLSLDGILNTYKEWLIENNKLKLF